MVAYLFVDGAYLRARLKHIAKRFSIDPLDLHYQTFCGRLGQKTFYYDCLPARSSKESTDGYDRRVEPERKFLSSLRALPGFHVFLGEAIQSGGTTRQKGVDILIAVHMMSFSFHGVIDRAVLFAGDRDFTPLVSALVQQGIYVIVAYHPSSVAEELLDAADDRDEYDAPKLWSLATPQFKSRFPSPEVGERDEVALSDPTAPVRRTGMFGTEPVSLYKDTDLLRLYLPYTDMFGNKRYRFIYHRDERVIMTCLDEKNIVVNWS